MVSQDFRAVCDSNIPALAPCPGLEPGKKVVAKRIRPLEIQTQFLYNLAIHFGFWLFSSTKSSFLLRQNFLECSLDVQQQVLPPASPLCSMQSCARGLRPVTHVPFYHKLLILLSRTIERRRPFLQPDSTQGGKKKLKLNFYNPSFSKDIFDSKYSSQKSFLFSPCFASK